MTITVEHLTRTFTAGRRRSPRVVEAVSDLTFSVAAGERLAFVGPNGAGKSTSIKMLTGVLYPTSGSATVLGYTPWTQRRQLAEKVGTLFGQRSQLWARLPPRRSFWMLAAIHDLDDATLNHRVAELGELLDADDLYDRPLFELSLGQRMRCELTATLLHQPRLLFLDEPTIGLDLVAKQTFRRLLVRLNQELGTTIVLTSHDAADIDQVAERVIVINHGRLQLDTDLRQLGADGADIEARLGELYEADRSSTAGDRP